MSKDVFCKDANLQNENLQKEILVSDPLIQALLKELPRWQEHVRLSHQRIKEEREFAHRVFDDAVAEMLKTYNDNEWVKATHP